MVEDDDTEEANRTTTQTEAAEEKDVGDAFELSQLLFIVGHVAIKHIVYLELVEREWKRQKHEREQGEIPVTCQPRRRADTLFCS